MSTQRRDVALHREDAVDDHQHAAAVALCASEHLLELLQPVVAEGAQLRAREQAAVEDRGVVAGVGDHGVADAEDRAERAEVGLVAGREHERVLAAHPLGDLRLQFEVQRRGAVQRARAGEAGAVAVQRVLRAGEHALVAGEAEVVVGAQHDPLRALHLHHRHRRGGEHVEVGQDVRLARRGEQLGALVVAGLGEDVATGGRRGAPTAVTAVRRGGRGHGGRFGRGGVRRGGARPRWRWSRWASLSRWACRVARVAVEIRPVTTKGELNTFIELPWRLYGPIVTSPTGWRRC